MGRRELGRDGFTLIETIVASMFGLLVLLLVLGVVQVQTRLQMRIEESVANQIVLDFAASVVTEEVRPIARDGIVHASTDSLVFRRPLFLGQFCATSGSSSYLYLPLDGKTLATSQIAGIAVRNGTEWQYFDLSWNQTGLTFSTTAAAQCAAAGTDTTGIRTDFASVAAPVAAGTVFSFYQLRHLYLASSTLNPGTLALFVSGTGETAQEMATGLAAGTQLSYRRNGLYLTAPTSSQLEEVDEIRFTAVSATALRPDAPVDSWTVDVHLPNVKF